MMQPVAITALGMVSSLGHDVETCCAAARAGLTRRGELAGFTVRDPEEGEEVPVIGHGMAGFTDGFEGLGRLVRLGASALADLLPRARLGPAEFARTAVLLNLPGRYCERMHALRAGQEVSADPAAEGEFETLCRAELIGAIAGANDVRFAPSHQLVHFGDHGGFASLLHHAVSLLRSGGVQWCIIGGIDSRVDPAHLEAAWSLGLVKDAENPQAPIPGEAAALLLLEAEAQARARGAEILGLLEAPAATQEACHRLAGDPSLGVALTQTISETLQALADQGRATGLAIADLNGDPVRAVEWGYAAVRLVHRFPWLQNVPYWLPAEAFGEIGAATGPVAACMAVRGFARRYAGTDDVLVWLSSDDGTKGSFYVRNHSRS
jgi:3-oxoacyl-(acyl-carrier-protein) synthase